MSQFSHPHKLSIVLGEFDSVYLQDMFSDSEKTTIVHFLKELGIKSTQDIHRLWTDFIYAQGEPNQTSNGLTSFNLDSMERGTWRVSHQNGIIEKITGYFENSEEKHRDTLVRFFIVVCQKILPKIGERIPMDMHDKVYSSFHRIIGSTMVLMGSTKEEADQVKQTLFSWLPDEKHEIPSITFTKYLPPRDLTQVDGSSFPLVEEAINGFRQSALPVPQYNHEMAALVHKFQNNPNNRDYCNHVLETVREEITEFENFIRPKANYDRALNYLSEFFTQKKPIEVVKIRITGRNKIRLAKALGRIHRQVSHSIISMDFLKFCVSTFDCFDIDDLNSDVAYKTRLFGYMTRGAKSNA
jgi:hypothetical protein